MRRQAMLLSDLTKYMKNQPVALMQQARAAIF
jgi:hypothetical protein